VVKLITLESGHILNVAQITTIEPVRKRFLWAGVFAGGEMIKVSLDDRKRIIEALKEMEAASFPAPAICGPGKISVEDAKKFKEALETNQATWQPYA